MKININKKSYNLDKANNNFSEPNNIHYIKDLVQDAKYSYFLNHDEFCIFTSTDNIIYLIYVNKINSIICYDLLDNKKINEIKNAHNKEISSIKYFVDNYNKRNLIISISYHIKLWDIKNLECLLILKPTKENLNKYVFYGCFLNKKNHIYIIVKSSVYLCSNEPIKVYDLKGKKIKSINNSNKEATYYLDNYYDEKLCKNYIVSADIKSIKSYKFDENVVYHIYKFKNSKINFYHFGFFNNYKVYIIGMGSNGIYIWDFHEGILLFHLLKNKISGVNVLCTWNNNYFFVGLGKDIELIKIGNNKKMNILNKLNGHENKIIHIKKIMHNKLGECLITQDEKGIIKLWINKK